MALMTIDWNPSPPKLRQFAGIAGAALLTLAVWAYFRHGGLTGAAGLAVIGLTLGLCGARWPRGVRPLYVGMMVVTFPIGWVVSLLVLAVLYFGVFTSVALI